MNRIAVIIVAGGSGSRMGAEVPKQFLVLDGLPILMHTIRRFAETLADARTIVVLPAAHIGYWRNLCRNTLLRRRMKSARAERPVSSRCAADWIMRAMPDWSPYTTACGRWSAGK